MAPPNLPLCGRSLPGNVPRSSSDILSRSVLVARSSGLSSGAKAGVALGCIFGAAILFCIAWPFIARLRRKLRSEDKIYHPSQEDPFHIRSAVSGSRQTTRRLSVKTLEEQQKVSSGAAPDPAEKTSERSGPDQNFGAPSRFQDVAYQASPAQAAPSPITTVPQPVYHGDGSINAPVPIEPTASRFELFKDNAKNKLAWSTDKAQFLKKTWQDIKREGEASSAGKSRILPEEDSRRPFPWFASIFQTQNTVPVQGAAALVPAPLGAQTQPPQLLSPVPSGVSPPVSPHHRLQYVLDTTGQPDSTLLKAKSGLPSPPLVDQATFDPKYLWNPTNPSERQHNVERQLVMLERASATASSPPLVPMPDPSPSPSPCPSQDHLRPPEPMQQHVEPTTPPSQPVSTPQTHDSEMLDVVSDFSTPQDRLFVPMSNQDTPDTNFTDSEAKPASPKSHDEESLRPKDVTSPAPSTIPPPSVTSPREPLSSVGSPGSYICDECGKEFEQTHRLNHHKRYHERKHECTVEGCNKKFGTKTHLDRHINDKHKKTRKFYCTEPSCPYSIQGGKSFPRKDNWVRHIRKKHHNLSVGQVEAQGFLIDEETGTAQSVAAPPSQNMTQTMNMGYGMPPGMPMPMGQRTGGGMSNGISSSITPHMNGGMNSGMNITMGMNMGGMLAQQPPMPPATGFNSAWNMGSHTRGY